jgi:hypothetical protein
MQAKILGYNYAVELKILVGEEGAEEKGRTYPAQNLILISPNQCRQMQESALVHEVFEVLNYSMGLGLNEQQIMSLEAGWYQVLTDNPKLIGRADR